MSRSTFDSYLVDRLLTERGTEPVGGVAVQARWTVAPDELTRRSILLTQLDSLRIRRGVIGRYFDADRVLLAWQPPTTPAAPCRKPAEAT
jgi:hypothetical protein